MKTLKNNRQNIPTKIKLTGDQTVIFTIFLKNQQGIPLIAER